MQLTPLLTLAVASLGLAIASPVPEAAVSSAGEQHLEARQSESFGKASCNYRVPTDFRAYELGNGQAQLTFDKDQYIGYQWVFDAIYPDGSTRTIEPYRDFNDFRISDTFYTQGLGTQYVTRRPGSSRYTAVHEFSNIASSSGQLPTAWVFRTTSANTACHDSNYRFNSGRISVTKGVSRPAQVANLTARRINSAGDFAVNWSSVAGAVTYNVLAKTYVSGDEVGNPYDTYRGARVQGTSDTQALGNRYQNYEREFTVTARNAQGVWSYTPTGPLIKVRY